MEHFERTANQEGGALNREGHFQFNLTQFKEKGYKLWYQMQLLSSMSAKLSRDLFSWTWKHHKSL